MFEAYPEVIAPSKKAPGAALLLSPPVPRTMPPSFFIGAYPDGRAPLYSDGTVGCVASPPSKAKFVVPSLRSTAVTKGLCRLVFDGLLDPLPMNTPFSRSAWIHGPGPEHGEALQ